jgi:hypothetical protein
MMKIIEGKEGWLFLDNDTNRSWDQFEGRRLIDPDNIEAWRAELIRRKAAFEERGIHYRFAIGPSKETIYPEFAPDRFRRAYVTPLTQMTALAGKYVETVDLVPHLLASKHRRRSYDRGDTHWNQFGGFVAANAILASLGLTPISETECVFGETTVVGDLSNKLNPPEKLPYIDGNFKDQKFHLVHENNIVNHGYVAVYENREKKLPRIIIFGDSFVGSVRRWLCQRSSKLIRIHTNAVDLSLIDREKPNIVISLITERFAVTAPPSCDKYRVEQDIARKIPVTAV